MTGDPDDDLVPISVRLGEVVPPEDPEDWTRPLTWVAAFGMLAGPLIALAWFVIAPPSAANAALPATYLVAALVVIILGVVMAGERQVGVASPSLAHAFVASVAGLSGAAFAAVVAAVVSRVLSRLVRFLPALGAGAATAFTVVGRLLPG